MSLTSLSRLGTGIAVLCLAGLLSAQRPAVSAEPSPVPSAVVIASTADGYATGDPVHGSVRVPDGASLVLLLANGRMVEIDGFYEGPADAPGPADAGRRGGLLRANSVDESTLGGARGIDEATDAPGGVPLAAGAATTICGAPGQWPVLSRGPGLDGPLRLTGTGMAPVDWPAADRHLALPAEFDADGPLDLRDPDGHIVARAVPHVLPATAALSETLTALAGAGCRQQSTALAARLRDAAVGLDLAIRTDRGRRPRYRVGEPIRLSVRVNRRSHVHCLVRSADGPVPIFPPLGSLPPIPPTAAIDIPGGALPLRLAAAPPAGATTVRCIAVLPPGLDALPRAPADAAPLPLPPDRVAAMEQALAALPMDRWTADTLTVEVVE